VSVSFFTEAEQEQLRVARMIIHVIGRQDEVFQPASEVPVQEELFFRSRILAEASDAVHQFDAGSLVQPIIERMARDEISFERGGQKLAQLFARDHVRQATSGAFFVLQLEDGDDTRFYALIKYDYREVVELAQMDGRNVLRAIVQAFVKERKAVQKICIVRVVGGVAEPMVSAADRMHQAPDLTDYFARYLGVSRNRDDTELSDRLHEAMRGALRDVSEHLPQGGVPAALRRMKEALRARRPVTNDDVVDAALHAANRPEEERIRAVIERKARMHLRRQGLDDVTFQPQARIFQLRPREFVRTAEEVRIEYPAEQIGQAINRSEKDGVITFTVTTRRIVEDGTLSSRPRARD
jgi:hypothetical protein